MADNMFEPETVTSNLDALKSQWDQYLQDPKGRQQLMQFGISMLQPLGFGETSMGRLGSSIASVGEQQGRIDKTEQDRLANEANIQHQKAQEAISRGNLGVAQGNLGVSQGNLKVSQSAQALREKVYNETGGLNGLFNTQAKANAATVRETERQARVIYDNIKSQKGNLISGGKVDDTLTPYANMTPDQIQDELLKKRGITRGQLPVPTRANTTAAAATADEDSDPNDEGSAETPVAAPTTPMVNRRAMVIDKAKQVLAANKASVPQVKQILQAEGIDPSEVGITW